MIILVDGPDGTGKTGYAQWISNEIGFPFLRLEPDGMFGEIDGQTIERMSSVFNYTLVQLDEQHVDVVVDRGPISSIVYSRVFQRGRPDHAHDVLDSLDPHVIYLRCDPRELEIRYDDEKFDNIGEIAVEYDGVMDELSSEGVDINTVDTSSGSPGEIDDLIHHWIVEGNR